MWWINKSGNVEGPFSSEQIEKRVKLNMLRSLDRVSDDKAKWYYIKDTVFWNPIRTIKDPLPPPPPSPSRAQRIMSQLGGSDSDFESPNLVRSAEQVNTHGRAVVPDRFRLDEPIPKAPSNKGLWIALIAITVVALAGFGVMAYFMMKNLAPNHEPEPVADTSAAPEEIPTPPQIGFSVVKDKLVIIECKEGSGSGFLLEIEGKTYLMTNEHVVRSAGTPRARLLDGTPLNLGAFSVATDRDLARFEISGCSVKPFKISDKMPNTGDVVSLYGNTLGGGVATESKGYVQGVGPNRIEANVEIVHGNSGSPLVAADGLVIGVASFVLPREQDDFQAENTRYEHSPRRFAIRFNNVEWISVDRSLYEGQILRLQEIDTYWKYLLPYLYCDNPKVNRSRLVFREIDKKNFKLRELGFEEILEELSKAYKKRTKRDEKWVDHRKGRKAFIQRLVANEVSEEDVKRAIQEYDQKDEELFEKDKEAWRNMILKRKEALSIAQGALDGETWDAPQVLKGYGSDPWERAGSIQAYREIIKECMDEANQDLMDLNKRIKELENGDDDDDDE